jgi:hypothetical protein
MFRATMRVAASRACMNWQQVRGAHLRPTSAFLLARRPYVFGAAWPAPRVERLDLGVDSGVLAMDAYAFWPPPAPRS